MIKQRARLVVAMCSTRPSSKSYFENVFRAYKLSHFFISRFIIFQLVGFLELLLTSDVSKLFLYSSDYRLENDRHTFTNVWSTREKIDKRTFPKPVKLPYILRLVFKSGHCCNFEQVSKIFTIFVRRNSKVFRLFILFFYQNQ